LFLPSVSTAHSADEVPLHPCRASVRELLIELLAEGAVAGLAQCVV
jgi:hypothetical protein